MMKKQTKIYFLSDEYLYVHHLEHQQEPSLTISNEPPGIWLPKSVIGTTSLNLAFVEEDWYCDGHLITPHVFTEIRVGIQTIALFLSNDATANRYDTSRQTIITIGSNQYDTIQLHDEEAKTLAFLKRDESTGSWSVEASSQNRIYHNQKQLLKDSKKLIKGDHLFIQGLEIIFATTYLVIKDNGLSTHVNLGFLGTSHQQFSEEYPNYHRSPRIIYREPVDKITITPPPAAPQKPNEQLIRIIIPPISMLAVTIAMSFLMPSNILMRLVAMLSTGVTTVFSIVSYFKNLQKFKEESLERETDYTRYLQQKAQAIAKQVEEQKHALHYHLPSIATIMRQVQHISNRIFEKTVYHHDFLEYRLGLTTVKTSFEIAFEKSEALSDDVLIQSAAELQREYMEIATMPLAVSLMQGPVGYVGPRHLVKEQLELMLLQLAFFHSYHDIEMITMFPDAEKADWDWLRWLPHSMLRALNVRGLIYHDRSRDQVLSSLYQILKERRQVVTESGREIPQFVPRYIITVTDEKFILDHPIMEILNGDPSELGVSIIFVEEVVENLSEHVRTILDIRSRNEATIVLEAGVLVNRKFVPDHFPVGFVKEMFSRSLAPLNHVQNLTNTIPEKVTFIELYGVQTIMELDITTRWQKNAPHKSLAVPLGLRGKDDVVMLNLHEKAHGPHGLVAGTTGSGKSEIIQSYILSLAVNFHPYEVAFLLIDYKGGGMANLFKNLPHHLGSITNLDGAQSMRALISIKAELQRRQRLFSENDVNHINQYQKLWKENPNRLVPMPHLFLISDEFAELKAEQPEFMKELVSTARIGRSLGIHLILATQKPSGVVDDQIWSNSKFKLALKVQNASDSNEILKTPDAANITLPGRAYLQVGNNEIYELFQSAWSGADYITERDENYYVDDTIYKINELGQYEILSEDLSGLDKLSNTKKVPSELEAIIDYLDALVHEQKITKLPQPWLPALAPRLDITELAPIERERAWNAGKKPLEVTLGILDQPEIQAQNPFVLNLSKDGHLGVFSSPGFGKSTLLQTLLMQMVRSQSPASLNLYLLDFGTNGLMPLKDLPHTADRITLDEIEKVAKFTRRLSAEMKNRKKLLSDEGVANLEMFTQLNQQRSHPRPSLPEIVIAIDNYDAIRDAGFAEGFEQILVQIGREGASLGIHLLISAGRTNSIKYQLLASLKLQLSLFIIDKSETVSVVGRSTFEIEELPGRGLIKLEQPTIFQTALPVTGNDDVEVLTNLQAEVKLMNQAWTQTRPKPIPMVPEVLKYEDFITIESVQHDLKTQNLMPLGVDYEDVQGINWNMEKGNLLLAPNKLEEMDDYVTYFVERLKEHDYKVNVLDMEQATNVQDTTILANLDEINAVIERTHEQLLERIKAYSTYRSTRADLDQKDFFEQYERKALIVYDSPLITKNISDNNNAKLIELLQYNAQYGFVMVVVGDIYTLQSAYDAFSKSIKNVDSVIMNVRIADQSIFSTVNKNYKETHLLPQEAYFIQRNFAEKIKLMKK